MVTFRLNKWVLFIPKLQTGGRPVKDDVYHLDVIFRGIIYLYEGILTV